MWNIKNVAFWLVLFLLVVALFNVFSSGSNLTSSKEVSYSEFLIQVEKGNVSAVRLDGERIIARDSGGNTYQVIQPSGASTVQKLEDAYSMIHTKNKELVILENETHTSIIWASGVPINNWLNQQHR